MMPILSRYIAEDDTLPAKQIAVICASDAADLNHDTLITVLDAALLLRKLTA